MFTRFQFLQRFLFVAFYGLNINGLFSEVSIFSKVFIVGLYECHKRLIWLKLYFLIVNSLLFALYGLHKSLFLWGSFVSTKPVVDFVRGFGVSMFFNESSLLFLIYEPFKKFSSLRLHVIYKILLSSLLFCFVNRLWTV